MDTLLLCVVSSKACLEGTWTLEIQELSHPQSLAHSTIIIQAITPGGGLFTAAQWVSIIFIFCLVIVSSYTLR